MLILLYLSHGSMALQKLYDVELRIEKRKDAVCVALVSDVHLLLLSSGFGVLQELYRMELAGEWDAESVKCSDGEYAVEDYWSWKGWRDGLTGVQALGDVGR